MKHIIGEIYEKFLQEKYNEYKNIDDEMAKRFLADIAERENALNKRGASKDFISNLELLNEGIIKDLEKWDYDFTNPIITRTYGRIYGFLQPVINKYEKQKLAM